MLSSKAIGIIKNSLMLAYDLTNGDDDIEEVFHEFTDYVCDNMLNKLKESEKKINE